MIVLAGVDLDVQPGEILGILGPNGAGKSTLFNLIGGVLAPSSGTIAYMGRDVGMDRPWTRARAGLGRTYQIPKPFSRTTVFENVLIAATSGSRLSVSRARTLAAEVLERTGLSNQALMLARDLSLLDLKRLELAKALALRPKLLLLDEIAGGLTDGECDVLLDMLRGIHGAGTTIIWIEHVLHVLTRAATRLAVLNGGTIMATGDPATVLADPRVQEAYLGV